MQLTAKQVDAIKGGAPVRLTPDEVGAMCVVVRADVFDQMADYGAMNPEDAYPALLEAWDANGHPDDAEDYAA